MDVAWRHLPKPVLAGLLSAVTAASGSLMNCLIRIVSEDIHPFEIAFFRNLFGFVAVLPIAIASGGIFRRTGRPGRLFLSAFVNTLSMLCFFSAVPLLPLNELTALSFTQPLFATVGAALVLGEVVRRARWTGTIVGFLGMLIVLRPGTEAFAPAAFLVLFGASAYAAVALIVKSISATEGAAKIVLLTTASMSCMTLPAALMVWRTPELMHFVLLAGIGCCGTLGWLAFAQAFRYADASALAPYDFLRLPFVAVPAFILFGEVPDLWTWIGAAVIFGSSVYFTRSEARATRSA